MDTTGFNGRSPEFIDITDNPAEELSHVNLYK